MHLVTSINRLIKKSTHYNSFLGPGFITLSTVIFPSARETDKKNNIVASNHHFTQQHDLFRNNRSVITLLALGLLCLLRLDLFLLDLGRDLGRDLGGLLALPLLFLLLALLRLLISVLSLDREIQVVVQPHVGEVGHVLAGELAVDGHALGGLLGLEALLVVLLLLFLLLAAVRALLSVFAIDPVFGEAVEETVRLALFLGLGLFALVLIRLAGLDSPRERKKEASSHALE